MGWFIRGKTSGDYLGIRHPIPPRPARLPVGDGARYALGTCPRRLAHGGPISTHTPAAGKGLTGVLVCDVNLGLTTPKPTPSAQTSRPVGDSARCDPRTRQHRPVHAAATHCTPPAGCGGMTGALVCDVNLGLTTPKPTPSAQTGRPVGDPARCGPGTRQHRPVHAAMMPGTPPAGGGGMTGALVCGVDLGLPPAASSTRAPPAARSGPPPDAALGHFSMAPCIQHRRQARRRPAVWGMTEVLECDVELRRPPAARSTSAPLAARSGNARDAASGHVLLRATRTATSCQSIARPEALAREGATSFVECVGQPTPTPTAACPQPARVSLPYKCEFWNNFYYLQFINICTAMSTAT